MGTILQERVAQQHRLERAAARERERELRRKAPRSNSRPPNVASNKMGRRQSQRRSVPPHCALPSQDNSHERRQQQRRKHKPHAPLTKSSSCQLSSVQGNPGSNPVEDGMEPRHSGPGGRGRGGHAPSSTGPRPTEGDSDTDLSESERRGPSSSSSSSSQVPPRLELRPEVVMAEGRPARSSGARGRGRGGFDFPDFLPPPFNSWSLCQLAVFYHAEGPGAPRPRPVGCLERYLERLLQLEWRQIQTVQEESGGADVAPGHHRSPAAAAAARLSSPKCILQCQRAFPLSFLSPLTSHAPSGCARHAHARQSRLSPTLGRGEPAPLPRRSYSESRAHAAQGPAGGPGPASSHLRRMQASGNLRNPAPGPDTGGPGRERPGADAAGRGTAGGPGGRRSGSEQRGGGGAERRRSGSETGRRRAAEFKEREVKPDAVTAIMDNLPGSRFTAADRPNRPKQVDFVT